MQFSCVDNNRTYILGVKRFCLINLSPIALLKGKALCKFTLQRGRTKKKRKKEKGRAVDVEIVDESSPAESSNVIIY